jgi:hypothetical protein
MAEIGKCKNCKNWDLKFDEFGNRHRECDGVAAIGIYDAAPDDGFGVYVHQGSEADVAGFRTGPEFGCVAFERADEALRVLVHLTSSDGAFGVGVLGEAVTIVWNRPTHGEAVSASLSVLDQDSGAILEVAVVDGSTWNSLEDQDLLSVVEDRVRRGLLLATALDVVNEVMARIDAI